MPGPLKAFLMLCAVLILLLPAPGWGAGGGRQTPPPPAGDWWVNDTTELSGESILLNGNLTIGYGGSLELVSCTLTLNCSFPGQYRVSVLQGGSLVLRGSTLQSANASRGFLFNAQPGSILELSQSTVRHAGVGKSADGSLSGLRVLTPLATIHNSTFELCYQGLHVRDTSVRISDCTFRDSEAGAVAYNSSLTVLRCSFSGINHTSLSASDRSTLTVTDSVFTGARKFAIYANHSSLYARHNSFVGNYNAIWAEYGASVVSENSTMVNNTYRGVGLMGCGSARVSDHTIEGTQVYPLEVRSTQALLENITLTTGLLDIYLTDRAVVECVNCTVRPTNVSVGDAHSRLNVSWFLGARVVWWSNETPVQGAEVRAYNASGALAFQGVTGAQGRMLFGKALEYTYTRDLRTYYGPYRVVATKGSRSGSSMSSPDRSLEVLIRLDDIGPEVRIESPENNTHIPTTSLELRGTAWDNETAVTAVEYRVDGGPWRGASGGAFWSAAVNLSEGRHTIQVRAWDSTNNTGAASLTVTVDTRPPMLCVTAPRSGNVTRSPQVLLLGYTEAGAEVWVNEAPLSVDSRSGAFNASINLTEGDNTISVVARDAAGNTASLEILVRLDTMIHPFNVHPPNGTATNISNLTIFGEVEENTTLSVFTVDDATNETLGELHVNVTQRNFSIEYPLRNGTSHLRVEARDRYGNNATLDIYVVLDVSPPLINVSSPPSEEFWTRERRLVFAGVVERGARLLLNGKQVLVEDESFSKALTLDPGENVFVLSATDSAGNTRELTYRVFFDRVPPPLNVTGPKNGARTTARSVLVRGFTEGCATVLVNGRPAHVDASGAFRKEVELREGNNTIEIIAYDRAGNPTRVQRLVVRERPPPLLSELQLGALAAVVIVAAFVAVVAWDTKRATGRWGIRRPAWLRVPERLRALLPRPTFGRDEHEARAGAVQTAAGKEGAQPGEHRKAAEGPPPVPPAGAPPAPAAQAPAVPPAPPTGAAPGAADRQRILISEKPSAEPFKPLPAPTEVPVPVTEEKPAPAPSAPPAQPVGPAAAAPAPPAAEPGGAAPSAPAARPPEPQPPAGPRPEELDPLAEILGAPTKKL
ncbi:MAG: right-handed parallel beta-helix repeat-containing protein [Thermoplasmatota archaeon]